MPTKLTITPNRLLIMKAIHDGSVHKRNGLIWWLASNITAEFTKLQAAGYAGVGSTTDTSSKAVRPVKLTDKGRTAIGIPVASE